MKKLLLIFYFTFNLAAQVHQVPCAETPRVSHSGDLEFVDCNGKIKKAKPNPPPAVASTGADQTLQPSVFADPETQKAYNEFIRAGFSYNTETYKHNADLYKWQHTSTVVIFWVVIGLVLSGLGLAAIQFYIAMKAQMAHVKLAPKVNASFEASLKGLKISSSVIGLVILAMSMVFFAVYIKYVYPIHSGQ